MRSLLSFRTTPSQYKAPVIRKLAVLFLVILALAPGMLHAQKATPSPSPEKGSVAEAVKNVGELWNTPVIPEETNKDSRGRTVVVRQGISVGSLVIASIFLLIGLLIAQRISRLFGAYAGRRLSIDPSRRDILQKLLFTIIAAVVVFTILNWLDIPLTTFAFLGGALAIGVGFGTQTLMNNFISGIILMAEQQVKVGDIITIETNTGKVTHLGGRCTRVLLGDNSELLVPNSYLLEKNVINQTLGDSQRQFDFIIGVSYGSPIQKVLELLQGVLEAHPKILKSKPRQVFFEQFGPSSLNFHLYYSLDVRASDNRAVGSELRLSIDTLCKEQGIEIASPQRDIFLHAPTPIAVRLDQQKG